MPKRCQVKSSGYVPQRVNGPANLDITKLFILAIPVVL